MSEMQKVDDGLTDRERLFRDLRADGLDLRTSYAGAGYDLGTGWRGAARELETRLRRKQRELEKQQRERLKAIEREQHRARTGPVRAAICATLQKILDANAGAAIGDDGRLDAKALKASGIGPAIRSIGLGDDGKLRSIKLHGKATAARLLDQLA